MGFLDRLLGREPQDRSPVYGTPPPVGGPGPGSADDAAIERYRYLLRTAPPEAVERAHAEAFARLTPEQRRSVLSELAHAVPPEERAPTDGPQDLARMATRAEVRRPGTLERTFADAPTGAGPAGPGTAPGLGAMFGTSMLGTVAGVVVGSTVASMLFGPTFGDMSQPLAEGGPDDGGAAAGGADGGSAPDGGFGGFDDGGLGGFDGF
ncbi:hypothetical protein [Cellulosimicrobium arenosum]|uniref:Uncharacterized protein n=1 Tax=Cellulosimicrobium arenosum TaxID=2708133 RepID=A0A927G7W9_9MICO|nr:hypothetical protein [Cellulosimicrobium arenosum]MBD8078554.1 hypothetical protein [Cellulosimicrobium arenosum]